MLEQAEKNLSTGNVEEAAELVNALLPDWPNAVYRFGSPEALAVAMKVSLGLRSAESASSLLEPFGLEAFSPDLAPSLVDLLREYGVPWWAELLASWAESRRDSSGPDGVNPEEWAEDLPRFCASLVNAGRNPGKSAARRLLEDRWRWVRETLQEEFKWTGPSESLRRRAEKARPLASILRSAEAIGTPGVTREITAFFRDPVREELLPVLLEVLGSLAGVPTPPGSEC